MLICYKNIILTLSKLVNKQTFRKNNVKNNTYIHKKTIQL